MTKTTPLSLALLALLSAVACGGASSGTAAAPATSPGAATSARGARQRLPGVTGRLAAIQGTTLQIQSTSGQTAVVYTTKTDITQTVEASRAGLAVGQCVSVRAATAGGASSSGTPVTAGRVVISAPVNGSCTRGFGSRGRSRGARRTGALASPRPSKGTRSGGSGLGAVGKVTAITGTSFTVASAGFGRRGATTTASPASVVVATNAATTFARQRKATPTALKTGLCVTARGPEDSSGTMTAKSLELRPAVNGTCSSGQGTRRG